MKGLIGFHVRFYDYEANFYPRSRAHLRARIRLSEFIHPLSGPIKMDAVSGCLQSELVCTCACGGGTARRNFSRCCLTMPGCVDGPLGMREVE